MTKQPKGSQEFYEKEVTSRRKAVKDLVNDLSFSVVSGLYKDRNLLTDLTIHVNSSKKMGDFTKDFSKELIGKATKNQISAAVSAKKHCYHYAEFVRQVLEYATDNKDLRWLMNLYDLKVPEKVQYYLIQAVKCYHFECWDASIVMIARAIEFSLKEYLKKEKVKIKGPAVLGNLLKCYGDYGKKKDIMKYILEVQRMDKNICAHDSDKERQQMSQDEADHSWTAIRIILKELLSVEV